MATLLIIIIFLLFFLSSSSLLILVSCQNPSGFISLDCGLPANSSYTEPATGIIYDSDTPFVTTGTVHNISVDHIKSTLKQQLLSLRSFPEGTRNCYKLKVKSGTKYLIRASFLYGDYDGEKRLPEFDLHFGANFWDSIAFNEIDLTVHKEIIEIVSSRNLEVCLVNTGSGTPFISALELRPLRNSIYDSRSRSLATFLRLDVGSINNQTYRYNDDVYDRIWVAMVQLNGWTSISTSEQVDVNDSLFFQPSPAVMNTAGKMINETAPMEFNWNPPDTTTSFFIYMYFAEIQKLQANESRSFDIFLNGKPWYNSSISPIYLIESVVYSTLPVTGGNYDFSIVKSPNSTLPPILNAIEIYRVIDFPLSKTNEEDGEISQDIENLKMLETLDLSNNNLSGAVPDFLTQLQSLRVLNLERNNLSGLIPSQLIEKSKSGSLSLRFGQNPNLFTTTAPSEKKKSNIVAPVLASVGGFALLLSSIVGAIFWIKNKQRKQHDEIARFGKTKQNDNQSQRWEMNKKNYSYNEILRITNNFERLLGEGGFGMVYYGRIENTEVAVKMLSPQSTQGYQQFQAEVDLLMRVHHRNLTGLVGYCNEATNKGLIYEYMGRGNLGSLISGGRSYLLNWEDRLHIALDAAHGLEYLHNGIKPAIIHRDVKSTNILLDDNLRAKVADFGLSRVLPTDGAATHVTTNIVGTHGYLDPEYYLSSRLNEKSDVYAFGVILLELITGKPALMQTQDTINHVYEWVEPLLSQGDIRSIIDPRMKEDFDINTIWKAVDIAMSCSSFNSASRPNMSQVVADLNECLAMEFDRNKEHEPETQVADSTSLFGPSAR